jgi:hypothetical protein
VLHMGETPTRTGRQPRTAPARTLRARPRPAAAPLATSHNAVWAPAGLLVIVSLITAVGGLMGERIRVRDEVAAGR